MLVGDQLRHCLERKMFIREIEIENYRCFEKLHVALDRNCNVVIGNNGAGKTAFLEAVASAVSAYLIGFDGQTYFHISRDDIRTKRTLVNHTIDEQYLLPLRISACGEIDGREFPREDWCLELRNASGRTSHKGIQKIIQYVAGIQSSLREGNHDIVLPVVSYYSTARLWKTKKRRSDTRKSFMRQNGYLDCMAIETDAEKMYNWLRTKTLYKLQFNDSPEDLKCVMDAMKKSISVAFPSGKVKEVWYNLSDYSLEVGCDDNQEFPYDSLSDGFKEVIGLVGDIAYRMSVLNPNLGERVLLETPGVVIIDEIDLHLHPELQSEILSILTSIFPKVQFIVSSHSPSVISSVRKENILELEPGRDTPVTQEYEVYGNDANTILETTMKATSRPRAVLDMFTEAEKYLEDSDYSSCRKKLDEIASAVGEYDPELNRLRMELDFEERQT